MTAAVSEDFAAQLLHWYDSHGRKQLPWQHPREPYRVWLSEIMLQQTQVATVIPYFERFLARFPDVRALAAAPTDDVLQLWAGLGYYARARNLHRAAQLIVAQFDGEFPQDIETLNALPGIGRSTAAAILAQAHGTRHAILDGNVKRVLARYAAIAGWPGEPAVQKKLWSLSEALLPSERLADYTQAIMDLGAGICTSRKPQCLRCPVQTSCAAFQQNRVSELPASRPRRDRPQRRAHLLLVENADGALLMERRPPSGIWGSLWCPPMLNLGDDWQELLRSRYGLLADSPRQLAPVQHSFTHFDLELIPIKLASTVADVVCEAVEYRWVKLDLPDALPGLPAPVRRLLVAPPQLSLEV